MKNISVHQHNTIVSKIFTARGFNSSEVDALCRVTLDSAKNGIRSHNLIKAISLDDKFGSLKGGCIPNTNFEILNSNFPSAINIDARNCCGPRVAYEACNMVKEQAFKNGYAAASVTNAFHYLWGGSYALELSGLGLIGYTNCTALKTEMVPYLGTTPTLGTNPHTWSFPTKSEIGFDILIDWATSIVSMGKVQTMNLNNQTFDRNVGIDKEGNETNIPAKISSLLPFGNHKGYGLSLINELFSSYIGCGLPTDRFKSFQDNTANGSTFFIQAIHPDFLSCKSINKNGDYFMNVKSVIKDIYKGSNKSCIIPGQIEYQSRLQFEKLKTVEFTESEYDLLQQLTNCD